MEELRIVIFKGECFHDEDSPDGCRRQSRSKCPSANEGRDVVEQVRRQSDTTGKSVGDSYLLVNGESEEIVLSGFLGGYGFLGNDEKGSELKHKRKISLWIENKTINDKNDYGIWVTLQACVL